MRGVSVFLISICCFLFSMVGQVKANQISELRKKITENPKNYQAHFELAAELLKAKDYQGAAEEYQFLSGKNAQNPFTREEKINAVNAISGFTTANQFLSRVHMELGFALDFLNKEVKKKITPEMTLKWKTQMKENAIQQND